MTAPASSFYVAWWRSPEGVKTVLAKRGTSKLHLCVIGYPVTVKHLPIAVERFCRELDYPVRRAAKKIRAMGRTHGMTKAARALLKEAAA